MCGVFKCDRGPLGAAALWKKKNSMVGITAACKETYIYSLIQKDGLNFVCLYFLNYTWYVNELHNI